MKIDKTSIRYTILILLGVGLIYLMIFSITNEMNPTYSDCGVIKSKSSDEVAIKYGVRTELYLNIEFTNSGFRSIETNPTTYFKFKNGDKICFDLNKEVSDSYKLAMVIGRGSIVLGGFIMLVLFIMFLVGVKFE